MPYSKMTPLQRRAMKAGHRVRLKRGAKYRRGPYSSARPYYRRARHKARPQLSLGYKGVPNTYRFVRETLPEIIDLRSEATTGGQVAVLNTSNFQMNQLINFQNEFGPLFESYKIDKIVTELRPMWNTTAVDADATATVATPAMLVTRVNTKWNSTPISLPATDALIRQFLAQIQKKSESTYSQRRPLRITTTNPRTFKLTLEEDSTTGTPAVSTEPAPWLNCETENNIKFAHNALVFFQKMDQSSIQGGVYQYRLVHKVHFRVSNVG